jgi:competence protein ComEC
MTTLLYAAAFAFGAWCLQQQAALPPLVAVTPVVPLVMLSWIASRQQARLSRVIGRLLWALTFAVSGFLWAAAVADSALARQLPENWAGRDIRIIGTVAEMPQPGRRSTRFLLDVEKILTPGVEAPRRIALNWYEGTDADGARALRAGQRWKLTVRLRRPHGTENPHGFRTEPWLLERGIRAVGYVRADDAAELIAPRVVRPGYMLESAREHIRERLLDALEGKPYAGVIVALAIGDQRAIPAEQWKVFTRSGVNHLMSISGLHITMVSALVFAVVIHLWRKVPFLAARIPSLRAATVAGFAAALCYAALAGFAVPAQRTVYMLAAVALALWSGWRWPPAAILGSALFLVVAIDPMAVLSAGFWLSFGAVAAITLAGAGSRARRHWLAGWLRLQWAVTVALVPFLLALFQQVSLVSPLANAIAIPVVSLSVAPLALAAIVVPLDIVAIAAHMIMSACMWLLEALASLPAAVWQQHAPAWWAIPLGLLGAAWILMPRGFPSRWAGAALMLPMFFLEVPKPSAGELWLTVLDVGQGLSAIVRTRNHVLLFDTGPRFAESGDAGERIVVPNLRGAGISALDMLIVSHDDADHSGGAQSVLDAMPVRRLLTSAGSVSGAPLRLAEACISGQRWSWDGVAFEILHPQVDSYNRTAISDNDLSCVLRIETAHGSVLIPGDIEKRAEIQMTALADRRLAADVLVAPHHGSRTSSSETFLAAVGPRYVIVPVGYRNRFGHPHPAVSARYRKAGAEVLRTDLSGAVFVTIAASGIGIASQRVRAPRYWHGR